MPVKLLAAFLFLAATLTQGAAFGGFTGPGRGITGNDTGGIFPWTPENHLLRREIAADHCARYRKRAHITSVRRGYGHYIGFACRWDRRAYLGRRDGVLRSRM